jgi:hypothetical protein
MSDSYLTDQMKAVVGQIYERLVSYPVSVSDIRRWAIATYYPAEPPREFWDEEYAQQTRHGGIVAPHEFNPFAWIAREPRRIPPRADSEDINGIESALGIPGPEVRNSLNGGLGVQYGAARMRPGDVITSETAVQSYEEKKGRMGVMLLTRTVSVWTNQHAEMVKTATQTIIRY